MKASMWLVALITIVLCCGAGCVATPAPSLQVTPVTVAVEPTVVEVASTVVAVKEPEPETETETCTEYWLPGPGAPGFEDMYMTVDRKRGTAEITGFYMLDDRHDLVHETSMQSKTRVVQLRYFDDARPDSGIVSTVGWRRQTDGSCVRGDEREQFRIEAIRLEFRNDVLNIKSSAVITGPGWEGVWYRM